ATFTSPKFGYSIDLTNTVWTRRWTNLAQEAPFAEFGVLDARGSAAFCVIPVWIGDDNLNFDALAQALAARMGLPTSRESIFAVHTHVQGPVRGRAFACERTENGVGLLYRVRVLRGRGFAYLLAAWMNKRIEAASEFLDLAMDCVSFADKADPQPLIAGDRLRATHAAVWNDIGIALSHSEDAKPAAAIPWFRRAFEADRRNLVPLFNYADGLVRTGRAPEALAALDRDAQDDDRPSMKRLRAQVLRANGRLDEAIRLLADLQKAAPDDTDTALTLADFFLGAQRYAEALAECDRIAAAAGETVAVLQRKGVAEANLKRYREAKITLEKAHEKDPANADIKRLLEQVTALLGNK
ncbi:MAG TPA: tetratricopeptide repeat protein, partial [Chthoniobacteraceae bacterium]|nr:tetratricopeptide repeat protein [Chthoniobacteraceae bacterium]